ncbi:MAG: class I SAM-dependent methyltransferase [Myxococcaceae bacterium]
MKMPSYQASAVNQTLADELERLRVLTPASAARELAVLRAAGLEDGMSVLDAGGGPGFFAEYLLNAFPTLKVTCLDADPLLVEEARVRLAPYGGRAATVASSVEDHHRPHAYDFCLSRYVFQHLRDPRLALRALKPCLRPDGKLVIADVDDEAACLFSPEVDGLADAIRLFGRAQQARGGDRHVARKLPLLLKEAGYSFLSFECVPIQSEECGRETILKLMSPALLTPLVKAGIAQPELQQQIARSQQQWAESANSFAVLFLFLVVASP